MGRPKFDFHTGEGAAADLAARGEVRDSQLVLEVLQAGESSELLIDIDGPPQIGLTLGLGLGAAGLGFWCGRRLGH